MNVGIIGMGYVGITTATAFALKGHNVFCTDINSEKRKMLLRREIPFRDEELKTALKKVNNLSVFDSVHDFIHNCTASFLCVGTPISDDKIMNLEFIEKSARDLGDALKMRKDYHVVIVKSTVLPGTTEGIVKPIVEKHSGRKVDVASNPEFLREGCALKDALNPERIVIGAHTDDAKNVLKKIYSDFPGRIIITDIKTAELIKLASNAFLSLKISFANEIAILCEKIGIDVKDVMKGVGADSRIGEHFLNAGMGFGGPCLPKDLDSLISYSEEIGGDAVILKAAREVNEKMIEHVVSILIDELKSVKNKKISVFGLAFKEGVDDVRGSRALPLIKKLNALGAIVYAHDFAVSESFSLDSDVDVHVCSDIIKCIKDSHAIIIQSGWNEYKNLDFDLIKKHMKTPLIIDGRRILEPKYMNRKGFNYRGIGFGGLCR